MMEYYILFAPVFPNGNMAFCQASQLCRSYLK